MGGWKNPDEPEGVDSLERQLSQRSLRIVWVCGCASRVYHPATTHCRAFHSRGDGIPNGASAQ